MRTTGSHSIGFISSGQEDRSAGRICAIPNNIERQLGYNVISGIENLNLHRVPEPAIDAFIAVIKVRIRLFLKECESARELLRQPIAQNTDGLSWVLRSCPIFAPMLLRSLRIASDFAITGERRSRLQRAK